MTEKQQTERLNPSAKPETRSSGFTDIFRGMRRLGAVLLGTDCIPEIDPELRPIYELRDALAAMTKKRRLHADDPAKLIEKFFRDHPEFRTETVQETTRLLARSPVYYGTATDNEWSFAIRFGEVSGKLHITADIIDHARMKKETDRAADTSMQDTREMPSMSRTHLDLRSTAAEE